jgi:ACT domain-containing protein
VLGEDRVGIVAAVSKALAANGTNIEDIRQTIISGVFSMTMLVTVDEDVAAFAMVQGALAKVADDLDVQITLQREDVFRAMHRV